MCPQILTNTYQELNNKCQMYLLDYYRLNFVMVELLSNISRVNWNRLHFNIEKIYRWIRILYFWEDHTWFLLGIAIFIMQPFLKMLIRASQKRQCFTVAHSQLTWQCRLNGISFTFMERSKPLQGLILIQGRNTFPASTVSVLCMLKSGVLNLRLDRHFR